MRFLSYAAILAAGFLSACASTPHDYLSADTRTKIVSTEVVVPIHQNEIYVYVPPSQVSASAGAQAGLVGALVGAIIDASVDSIRTGKAETAVKPLRDAMVDYNFDSTMQGDMKNALAPVSWMGVDDVRVSKQITSRGVDGEIFGSKDGAILVADTNYSLSNDGDVLTVATWAALIPNNDALRAIKPQKKKGSRVDAANALYHNSFAYEVKLQNASPDRDKNIAIWSADHGALTRAALTAGAREVAVMLAADIQRLGDEGKAANAETATVDGQDGIVIATESTGKTVRFKDGSVKFAANAIQ
ncbi:MAG TPA: hypothetical protein VIM56_13955 [Rhizomicrobium sp.]